VFLVFAQQGELRVDLAGIVRNATRHFQADVEVLEERGGVARLAFEGATFTIRARASTDADRARARVAEARGRAGGMSDLAARCAAVWEVEAASDAGAGLHRLCAILATTALGPVLPPDDSTLYGVRGAMERAQRSGANTSG